MNDQSTPTSSRTMTCQELEGFIDDYLDNNLTEAKREVFDTHIDDCPDCYRFMINYRNAIRLGKTAYAEDYRDSFESVPENLVQAILKAKNSSN